MKVLKKTVITVLAAVMLTVAMLSMVACGGYKVTYVIPDGATGTAPASATYATYEEFTVPDGGDIAKEHSTFIGWVDSSGKLYEPDSKVVMGSENLTLTAAFEGTFLTNSFAANPGTFLMSQGRFIGPSPAHTYFYADKTWIADAEGGSCFSHWEGTWELSDSGVLSMTLVVQDGIQKNEKVEITDAENGTCFSFTLTHPGDRGGMKSHVNYLSKYDFITQYNEEFGTSIAAGTEPTFTITFTATNADDPDAVPAPITVKKGEMVTLPGAGELTREGYTFDGWTIYDYWLYDYTTNYPVGYQFPMFEHSVTATAKWVAAS